MRGDNAGETGKGVRLLSRRKADPPGATSARPRWVFVIWSLIALGGAMEEAWGHHGLYDLAPRDVLLKWIDGYQVRVQVAPFRPRAGGTLEFFLSVQPKGSYLSVPFVREARLWLSRDVPDTGPPVLVAMRPRENPPGVFTGEFVLREGGIYRVEVEVPTLRDRVSGSLRVEPPNRWIDWEGWYLPFVVLATGGFVFLLQRFSSKVNGLRR